MKKQLFLMFSGIFIGILVGLFLTLVYWGRSLDKIVVSIIAGCISGMFIADTKATLRIFKITLFEAWNFFILCFKKISGINFIPKKISRRTWIKLYLSGSIILKLIIPIIFLSCLILIGGIYDTASGTYFGQIFFPFFFAIFIIIASGLWISLIGSCGVGMDGEMLGVDKKIWKNKKIYYINSLEEKGMSFESVLNITSSKGILFIEKKSFLTFWYIVKEMIKWIYTIIKKVIIVGGFTIISGIISSILSVLFLPLWFLRELWKTKKLLVLALSVALGIIFGTTNNSFIMGVLTGFLIATISLFLGMFFDQKNFFFYWKKLLGDKNLWEKVLAI